ncbi:Prefoldin alpha-like [Cinara cedri]|uniref:Prefoldin alpha-like n=1 Tax=Cinara cedri TaxID=506608 RepID=A0A5E4MRE1_9HEMI|nr:Prefoldin alpha-like [Cinara cedri]
MTTSSSKRVLLERIFNVERGFCRFGVDPVIFEILLYTARCVYANGNFLWSLYIRVSIPLKEIFKALEGVNEEIMELERLRDNIEKMHRLAEDLPPGKPFKTRVNVGCDFYMQANVDVHKYLMCVGLGYYVEFNKDEALTYIRYRTDKFKQHAEDLRDKGARVRAQITLALHCIEQVQGL